MLSILDELALDQLVQYGQHRLLVVHQKKKTFLGRTSLLGRTSITLPREDFSPQGLMPVRFC